MSEHTPAPWTLESDCLVIGEQSECVLALKGDDGHHIAYIDGPMDDDVQEANANLIAASPDLLAAAEKYVALKTM